MTAERCNLCSHTLSVRLYIAHSNSQLYANADFLHLQFTRKNCYRSEKQIVKHALQTQVQY